MNSVTPLIKNNSFIIAKFGGTSVDTYESMNKSASLIFSNRYVRLVVLSASAGITNLLTELAQGCDMNKIHTLLQQVQDIQYAIINKIQFSKIIRKKINCLLTNIAHLANAASLSTSDALTDEIISHGELMSTLLFVEVLRQYGVHAKWFDVRHVMKTNATFGYAEPDLLQLKESAQLRLKPYLKNTLVITQGFIGQDNKNRTTTLGRGSSDYTAALLAEVLDISRVDIWTDVPGIYTTDPRIVSTAKRINEITFDEATEMATFGANILHPDTLLPAVRSGIPVFVRSSKQPELGGTLVCSRTVHSTKFSALALRRKQILLTFHNLKILHAHDYLTKVFTTLLHHNISISLITTSEFSIALALDTTGLKGINENLLTNMLITELSAFCRVEVEENLALVTIIGNELSKTNGLGKIIFSALESFKIRMISYGASSHNICLLVPGYNAEEIIRTLHLNLFE
ncbi:Lysine-sensitive aspartokinase 3 [Candidatus Hartigia pinicola]|nr:Lysine-sensitive aspartokinase 3 [Candidatus Hartigia pinicola]